MTAWQIAMLLALPLCLEPVRYRTWMAMFASGLLGYTVSWLWPAPILAFVAIDVATALVILARPKGLAQQYIGITYVGMICSHIGYAIAGNPVAITVYYGLLSASGWLAWGILLCWGASDVGKRIGARLGIHRSSVHRTAVTRK